MTPFTVDANAIHAFQEERISAQPGIAHSAISAIAEGDCIALDSGELCLQEWLDCAGGKFPFALRGWVPDQAVIGTIRYFDLADNSCRRDLNQLGLPQKDHKWVRLAIGSGGRRLVSGDVDFFDPRQKRASAATKARLRETRGGACARHLSRTYGIRVLCLEHVTAEVADLAA